MSLLRVIAVYFYQKLQLIDLKKKLEKQNKIMLDAIKEAVSYPDDYYWRIINELLEKTLQEVEGENQ